MVSRKEVVMSMFRSIIVLLVLFFGCADAMPDLNYSSKTNASFKVENTTKNNIVLFDGAITKENLIACVPSGATMFGVGDYKTPVFLQGMTDIEYLNNRKTINNAKISFSRLVVPDEKLSNQIIISSLLAGFGRVFLLNKTDFYIELRDGKWDGKALLCLAPHEKRLQYLPGKDYDFYPVMVADGSMKILNKVSYLSNSVATVNLSRKPLAIEFSSNGKVISDYKE